MKYITVIVIVYFIKEQTAVAEMSHKVDAYNSIICTSPLQNLHEIAYLSQTTWQTDRESER